MDTMYLVCGAPRHGKDTFGQYLADALGTKKGAPSDIIYEELAKRRQVSLSELLAVPKEDLRADLVALGDELCSISPTFLVDALRKRGVRVVTGVRRVAEALEVPQPRKIIWVECPDVPVIPDNTEYELKDHADIEVMAMKGRLDQLQRMAQQIAVEG